MAEQKKRTISTNKKAYHEYFVEETFETGIELCGTEVKSLRQGTVNMKDSFCKIINGELLVMGMHISPYEKGNIFNRDPYRERRLLLHKKQILKLFNLVGKQGYSIIPLSMYFLGKWVKIEIGLCKGKKLYDKREDEATKTAIRDMARAERGEKS
ncbi:MAG: SsrA-binding protein SmpB [Clostridia bacterium]